MSVQENAGQLISHANAYVQNGIAATNQASGAMNSSIQNLAEVQNLTTESMAQVSGLLGSGHPAIGAIGATANAVSQKAESVIGAINAAIEAVLELDHVINTHSNTMGSVGHALLQGGS